MWTLIPIVCVCVFFSITDRLWAADELCRALSPEQMLRLRQYVRMRYNFAVEPPLKDMGLVNGACFHKLQVKAPSATSTLTLFASPDGRFLSTDLFDSFLNPREEKERAEREIEIKLEQHMHAVRGKSDAPITVTIFSDFQCPFCKQASLTVEKNLAKDSDIRFSFRHFPLPQHGWARSAAEIANCAALEDGSAFWKLHDLIFTNQDILSSENIVQDLSKWVYAIPHINRTMFDACIAVHASKSIIDADIDLGNDLSVRATPTIFINGHRLDGAAPLEQILTIKNQILSRMHASRQEQ